MPRYHLGLEFCGTRFSGWLKQPDVRTVEGVLTKTLEMLLEQPINLMGCSRTDAGVHAAEYHVHLDVEDIRIPLQRFARTINAMLPQDMAVRFINEAPKGFHAVACATHKIYHYTVRNRPLRGGLDSGTCWHVSFDLDWDRIQKVSLDLVGEHNFKSFCSEPERVKQHIRRVMSLQWFEHDVYWVMEVTANGFLYNMVRIMVGTLIDIGRGQISANAIPAMLAAQDRRQAGPTAPARGLCLCQTFYE